MSNECRKLLESFMKSELKSLGIQTQNGFQYDDFNQRWYDLVTDIIFAKIHKKKEHTIKKAQEFIIPIFFDNKGLEFSNPNSILNDNQIRNSLPDPPKDDEVPSTVFSLANTMRNKMFSYKETVNNINTTDTLIYGTGINVCSCKNSNFINRHHGHIPTGDLRITENDKLRKILSTGPNYAEPKAIKWKKCKDNIITGIKNLIEGKLSSGKNITKESSSPWNNTIIE